MTHGSLFSGIGGFDLAAEWAGWDNKKVGIKSSNSTRKWEAFPTQPPVCGGDDGIPRTLDSISFPKWRNESIKAYGNAIVPQVAYQLFKTINEYEKRNKY